MPATQMPGAEGRGQLLRREPLQEPMDSLSVPARTLNEPRCFGCNERMSESFSANESKRALQQPPLTSASCEGAVRMKWSSWNCAHGTGTFHPAHPAYRVLRVKKNKGGSGGTSCGNMNCERLPVGASGAGELARGRRGRAMGWKASSVRHYRCLGANIFKCRVNDLCMCRTLVTMNCSGIDAKLQMDCNRFC